MIIFQTPKYDDDDDPQIHSGFRLTSNHFPSLTVCGSTIPYIVSKPQRTFLHHRLRRRRRFFHRRISALSQT